MKFATCYVVREKFGPIMPMDRAMPGVLFLFTIAGRTLHRRVAAK